MEIKDLEFRSEEAQEVLTRMPSWIIRWGMTVVFAAVAILLIISFLVKYPDTIQSKVNITTQHLPANIIAKYNGKIEKLFVRENQVVKAGEHLVLLENPADYEDMLKVQEWFKRFHNQLIKTNILTSPLPDKVNLGMAQNSYASLLKAMREYKFFVVKDFDVSKIARLNEQINSHEVLKSRLIEQKKIMQAAFKLTANKYENDKLFLKKEVISQLEFDNNEKQYLKEKYDLENIEIQIINTQIKIQELEKQILELSQHQEQSDNDKLDDLKKLALNLEADLASWEEHYLIKAPVDGQVSFFKFWAEKQYVNEGAEILYIKPDNQELFAYAYVNSDNFGKIKVGQEARIRLDGYPFKEFGVVNAIVTSKSEFAREGKYMVKLSLPQGLKTSYGKVLDFTQDMQGEVRIITEDLRLIERIFYQFRYLIEGEYSG
ncbi:HlyD family secretion protein [Thermoflexibacter ruber]|uniref:Multidrug resistance efflux pump n=1 Tax=Thermoflexibacter ruber TaxID=1003 RepID=A0A1I2DL86_9BACT|nr:HlyD family efflux transporter periplasmic adaptor subunit [Thermoflexibacter ruber]SFE81375.1 Multidrug resistance efflux pump [Thermoflexibacter ruber]